MTTDNPLHIRQAAGLRQLADAIEQDPEFAEQVRFALEHLNNFAVEGDLRADLLAFRTSALKAGAEALIDNKPDECVVRVSFGPIEVSRRATAARMSGQEPNPFNYKPLVIED